MSRTYRTGRIWPDEGHAKWTDRCRDGTYHQTICDGPGVRREKVYNRRQQRRRDRAMLRRHGCVDQHVYRLWLD